MRACVRARLCHALAKAVDRGRRKVAQRKPWKTLRALDNGQTWWTTKNVVPALAGFIVTLFCFLSATVLAHIVTESEAIRVVVGIVAFIASMLLGARISDRLGNYMQGRSSKFPYLDTPDKRASFVVCIFGLVLAGIGVLLLRRT